MIRAAAAKINRRANSITWRSHEPSRLETFSDAVFAFALTLIIVSLEIPKSFTDLIETLKGTLSFAACFAILFQIWNTQNLFFRRFGLNDSYTTFLNAILMFVVLVYVYPLKFLSVLLFVRNTYTVNGHVFPMIYDNQVSGLMVLYGAGFTINNLLFYLMHLNVIKQAGEIKLTPYELFETKTTTYSNFIGVVIGVAAMILAIALPLRYQGQSGWVYFSIPIALSVWHSYRGKKSRELFGA